jgi:hypothetical protein
MTDAEIRQAAAAMLERERRTVEAFVAQWLRTDPEVFREAVWAVLADDPGRLRGLMDAAEQPADVEGIEGIMTELIASCSRCGVRIDSGRTILEAAAGRLRHQWPRDPVSGNPTCDLCVDCAGALAAWLARSPETASK